MSGTTSYPVLFDSQFLGTSVAVIYEVPGDSLLLDLLLKLTNTTQATKTATVYATSSLVNADEQIGVHTGSDNASTLADSGQSWTTDQWAGYKIKNLSDGSSAIITANTATAITATLSGGTDNDWDTDDVYQIVEGPLAKNEVVPEMSIPPNDFVLVPVPRLRDGSEIYALASSATSVTIQAIGGKLLTL